MSSLFERSLNWLPAAGPMAGPVQERQAISVPEHRQTPLTVIYDRQCEICLAAVSWIGVLDRRGSVRCIAAQDGPLTAIHPALSLTACLSELHVVDAGGRIDVGWHAVARISRAIPAIRPLAALDRSAVTRAAADGAYRCISASRHQLSACLVGACVGAGDGQLRAHPGPFWAFYTLGLLLRLPLACAAAAADQFRVA